MSVSPGQRNPLLTTDALTTATTIPWTYLDAQHHLDITSDAQIVQNYTFSTFDMPWLDTTDEFVHNGDQADVLAARMLHEVPMIVALGSGREQGLAELAMFLFPPH